MSTKNPSKTSLASVISRIGIVMLILAVLALGWLLNSGDTSIFTGLFLVLIFIFVIPTAAAVLLISGLAGSAEMVQEKREKKKALAASQVDDEDGSAPAA